ncbi:MAG: Spy/CpxP family protein refolding chaperone [Granulosicoccus sp.]
MKRHTKVVLAAITAVTIATTTVVVAGGGHGKMGDRMVSKITKKLDLDEQQVIALQALQSEVRETRELMRGNLDSDRQTLGDLLGAETFDQGAALEMITARTTALQAQGPTLVAAAATFLDGLNAEQKQELNERMQWLTDHRGKRHGDKN